METLSEAHKVDIGLSSDRNQFSCLPEKKKFDENNPESTNSDGHMKLTENDDVGEITRNDNEDLKLDPNSELKLEISEPKSDKSEPKYEISELKSEISEPKSELILEIPEPKSEISEPKSEISEPKLEKSEPKSEISEPKLEKSEPKSEISEPKSEKSEPKSEKSESVLKSESDCDSNSESEDTNDDKVKGNSKRFKVGSAETIGRRGSMEDRTVIFGSLQGNDQEDYFAVFDGHGGVDASNFSSAELHNILGTILREKTSEDHYEKSPEDHNKTHQEKTSENIPGEKTSENIPGEKTSENIPGEKTSENIPSEKTSENIPGEKTSENIPGEKTSENIPGEKENDTHKKTSEVVAVCLKEAFSRCNESMKALNTCNETGTTAVVVYSRGRHLWVANAGDSRAVLSRAGQAVRVTTDHKPSLESEKKRILDLRGFVFFGRVNGVLAVSRALGDFSFNPHVTCEPDVFGPFDVYDPENQFLILACDGLWDVIDDKEAVRIISESGSAEKGVNEFAGELVNAAIHARSTDNVSVVVIFFPDYARKCLEEGKMKE